MDRKSLVSVVAASVFAAGVMAASADVNRPTPFLLSAGTHVAVTGSGFGSSPTVFFRNPATGRRFRAAVSPLPAPTDTAFELVTPPVRAGDYVLEVHPDAVAPPLEFDPVTVRLPAVIALEPNFGPPGTQVTAVGMSFGTKPGRVWVGRRAATVLDWTDERVTFAVPRMRAGLASVRIVNSAGSTGVKPGDFAVGPSAIAPATTHVRLNAGPFVTDMRPSVGRNLGLIDSVFPQGVPIDGVEVERVGAVVESYTADGRFTFAFSVPAPDVAPTFPHVVTGTDAFLYLSRPTAVGPSVMYGGSGTNDPQDPAHDMAIVIESASNGTLVGTFSGTLHSTGDATTLGDTIHVEGSFRTPIGPR